MTALEAHGMTCELFLFLLFFHFSSLSLPWKTFLLSSGAVNDLRAENEKINSNLSLRNKCHDLQFKQAARIANWQREGRIDEQTILYLFSGRQVRCTGICRKAAFQRFWSTNHREGNIDVYPFTFGISTLTVRSLTHKSSGDVTLQSWLCSQ